MRRLVLGSSILIASASFGQPGSLDPSYGVNGTAVLQPGSSIDMGQGIVAAPDSTSYVAGYGVVNDSLSVVVAHLLENGTLDSSFGSNGYFVLHAGAGAQGASIARATDGSLFVTGNIEAQDGRSSVMLCKLFSNGSLDPTFGVNGLVDLSVGLGNDYGSSVVLQPDGGVVVAGRTQDANDQYNGVLLRFLADGNPDAGFSGDGKLILTEFSGNDAFVDVALSPDGSIIAVGDAEEGGITHTLLAKALPNGTWDPLFGDGGWRTVPISTVLDLGKAVQVFLAGFYVCGTSWISTEENDGYVARFFADGSSDPAFNTNGVAFVDANGYDALSDLALDADGRVVSCGSTGDPDFNNGRDLLLVRYEANGVPDAGFGNGGSTIVSLGPEAEEPRSLALQPDGKILVAGYTTPADIDLLVARYLGGTCLLAPSVSPDALLLCPGASDTLSTGVFGTYQWFRNGEPVSGAAEQSIVVDQVNDAGAWFQVEVSQDGCTAISDSVLVDGYVFLLPFIINEGDAPNLIGNNGEQIYCQGDDPVLVLGAPYDTNVQWFNNGAPIPGANSTSYAVPGSGSYSVEGAPAVCPDFIQDAGITIEMDFHPYIQPTIVESGILLCPEPEGISSQWYYNGSPVAGLDQCVIPIDAGNYTVFVDYGDSCSVLSAPFSVVGVEEHRRSDMKASPVPTNGLVTITWVEGGPVPEWRIVDVTGRNLLSGTKTTSPLTLDLGTLDVGRYRFLSSDGRSLPLAVVR